MFPNRGGVLLAGAAGRLCALLRKGLYSHLASVRADSVVDAVRVKSDSPSPQVFPQERESFGRFSDIAKLAEGGLIGLIGKIGGQWLNVLGNIIVARILGADNYGLYAIGWTIMRMVGLIAPLGLDKGVVYFGTRYLDKDRAHFVGMLRQSIGVALLSGALLGGTLFVLAPWIGTSVFHKVEVILTLRWFALVFIAYAGLRVVAAATTVSQSVKFSVLTQDILQPSIFIVIVLAFRFCGIVLDVTRAIEAILISFIVSLVAAAFALRHLFPEIASLRGQSPLSLGRLLGYSVPTTFAGIFGMYMLWVSRLLVGYFRSLEETGVYQAASQIALLFPMIQASFMPIFLPMATDLHHRGERGRLNEVYKVSIKWVLYLSMPFLLVALVMSKEVMVVLFGSQYIEGWLPLVILVLAQTVNIATGPVGSLLVMTGYQRHWSIISGVAFLLNICLSAVLTSLAGMTGAAIALAVAYGGMFLVGVGEIRRLVGVWPYDRRHLKVGVAALLTAGALLVLREVTRHNLGLAPLVTLASGGVLAVGVFGGFLLWQGFDQEDQEFLQLIRDRWNRLRQGNGR